LAAFRVLARHPEVSLGIACFHAQQAVENSLKAVLLSHCIEFRRTHDLEEPMALLAANGIPLPLSALEIAQLTPCAVAARYDEEAVPNIAPEEMQRVAETVHAWATGAVAR
jgi:HEPN domain-containing protein